MRANCRYAFLLALALAILLSACASAPRSSDSLYRQLGGTPGIGKLTDAMLGQFADDPLVAPTFAHTDIHRFRRLFIEFICHTVGGPCEYTGDSMAEVHRGLNLSEAQFNALVEDLIAAMDERHIPVPTQNRLLALLAPMRGDIIYH